MTLCLPLEEYYEEGKVPPQSASLWGKAEQVPFVHHNSSAWQQLEDKCGCLLYMCCDFFLQKGAGYHLDLFWVAILMVVCSFMALPWYVAATVISIAHIDSLKMETETSAPGEQPKFLGVRYAVMG